ncbi:MAG TPA: hypothetical protein VGR47_16215 [Terracidiphilus sp.]|nr:hypothetical protein [Terracidiphilus sp.]
MRQNSILVALAMIFVWTGVRGQQGGSPTPRDQLQQYVTQLQADPSNDALRTKIIKLALTLDPKPAVPEEAQAADGKAKTIFAHATTPDDVKAAAAAFAQASQVAPWVSDYYFNEAAAAEKAAQYDEAIHALNFYLVAAPDAPDAGAVRGRIEGIKYTKSQPSSDSTAAHAALDNLWKSNEPAQIQFLGEGGGRIGFAMSTQQYPWRFDYWWQDNTVIETRCPGFRNRLVVGAVYSVRPSLEGGGGSIDVQGQECSLLNFAPYVEMECDHQKPYPYIGADGLNCSSIMLAQREVQQQH